MGGDELFANYTSTYRSVTMLPIGTSTILGVTKKQCGTCHTHDSKLRGMGAEIATGLLPANGSTAPADTTRTVYSAEFNLCVDCHQVKLTATFDPAAGYDGRGMFGYNLSSDYLAEKLICAACVTPEKNTFYHDGQSGTGRTLADTHFGGEIAEHLVEFNGSSRNITVTGYRINPGSENACTICHDPHTAGKMLSVPAGTTIAVDDNNNAAISYATGLGGFHTNYLADPFSRVNNGCQPCHSGSAFPRLINGADNADLAGPAGSNIWSVVGCRSCHDLAQANATPGINNAAAFDDLRQFPAGYQLKFNNSAAALTAADLGNDAICFECHKGRTAGVMPATDPAVGTQSYAISYLHYAPSMAILYGDDSKMVLTYAGKEYSGRFQHYDGAKFGCTTCHNVHTGNDVMETSASCNSCHAATSAVSKHNLAERTRKYSERLLDSVLAAVLAADGQFGMDATLQAKITEMKGQDFTTQRQTLMTYIQDRQVYFPNRAIAHAATTWKVFTYEDGPEQGQTHGHGGSWAHNSRFARQMMFDAIESLGGNTIGLLRPAVLSGASGPHEVAAAIAAETYTGGNYEFATVATNAVTAACSSCHSSVNFVSSRHANQTARAGSCSACHSHEGFVVQSGLGKFNGNDELITEYNASAYPELFGLPASTNTNLYGLTRKNCATCHDTENNNRLRGVGDEQFLGGTGTTVRYKFSAGYNLCTQCHMVKLEVTEITDGYGSGNPLLKYSLAADYAAENLIDTATGTYDFRKLFYHDGRSGTGRTFVDTHFGGTIASHLVNFDGSAANTIVKGYNINAGSRGACTICHDPHTAGKMLAVAADAAIDDNTNAAISFATGLGKFHTDYGSGAFFRGSDTAQSSSCMLCHNGSNFAATTEGNTSTETFWKVVGCNSCHNLNKPNSVAAANDAAAFDDVRQFPTGYQFKFNSAAAAVPAADLGDNAICFECHKGRTAGVDVALLPDGETRNYSISYLHYAPSMAILYGNDSKMVAAHQGKSYSGRFQHPVAVNGKTNFSCTDCHNVHTGANYMASEACNSCHVDGTATGAHELAARTQAFSERLLDTVLSKMLATTSATDTTLAAKLTELKTATTIEAQRDILMTYIEQRDVRFPTKAIAHAAVAWKVFTYEDGPLHGQAHGHGGSWAHNSKFARQVMYDAIENLGGDLTGLERPSL